MRKFMNENFLLSNDTAILLYHKYAKEQPIFDYHCHLSAKEIYENKAFNDIAEIWLGGDHYKWRMIRSNGVSERFVTGDATGYEKFLEFSKALTYAVGNPMYHWSHLELQRYFGINEVLNESSAPRIWEKANDIISKGGFTPRELINRSNVFALCTTEDLVDTLEFHNLLNDDENFETKILPALRPDRALALEAIDYWDYIKLLSEITGTLINSYEDLKSAIKIRIDDFEKAGCVASDHGFEYLPYNLASDEEVEEIFKKRLSGLELNKDEVDKFKTMLMLFLGKEYSQRGWAMELHVGIMRNCSKKMFDKIGVNTGFDSIGDYNIATNTASFLDELDKDHNLPKTILFTSNEKDNWVLATMLGNYQTDEIPSKVQFGTAWWFQDHRDGMEKQMRTLANAGLLGRFIGMLTDSRSFLSYPRHEYFRRILCNLIGTWVENGEYPDDMETLKMLISGICIDNAKQYFGVR